jgi:hypothetical protein
MHGHFDLKKSHFDSRNQVPDVDSRFLHKHQQPSISLVFMHITDDFKSNCCIGMMSIF